MKIKNVTLCNGCELPIIYAYLQTSFDDIRRGRPVRFNWRAYRDYIDEFGELCWYCNPYTTPDHFEEIDVVPKIKPLL
jgi:hypothetical protein